MDHAHVRHRFLHALCAHAYYLEAYDSTHTHTKIKLSLLAIYLPVAKLDSLCNAFSVGQLWKGQMLPLHQLVASKLAGNQL